MTTPILSETSHTAKCAVVTIDAPTLCWLLRIPQHHRLDTLTYDGETAQLLVSGPEMPVTEPGYPIPRMQLALTVNPQGIILDSRLAPINEDLSQPVEAA